MDTILWTKKIAGNEWLPADDRFEQWLWQHVEQLPSKMKDVVKLTLEGKSGGEIAEQLGMMKGTVYNRVSYGLSVLSAMLGEDRTMFKSIRGFEFSDEVDGSELAMCFYGRLSRNVQLMFLPKAKELGLPSPVLKGGKWVFTKEQAEAWREWFIKQRGGVR